jgi:2-polyprenyl-3-methyl-5-hydroxy-6-metoxy-1,4-benzoquinol methylase
MSFSDKLTSMLNVSAASTALGVASRSGLLAVLSPEPASAASLASQAGLSLRYTEEILAALVCGEVVVLAERLLPALEEEKYFLPSDRKASLDGMGLYFEELPLLAQCAFDQVCTAAQTGAGVAPSCYGSFGKWMGKLADEKHARQLVQTFLPALAGGHVVEALRSEHGTRVMDLGCGQGAAARLIAAAFPAAQVTGVDIDEASVAAAEAHPDAATLGNLRYVAADAASLLSDPQHAGLAGSYELVLSFDAIHDLADPATALSTAHSLLTETGLFVMVDIRAATGLRENLDHSMGAFLYTVSLMHCMPQGLNCNCRGTQGPGLGMMWGRAKATEMLMAAGFASVEVLELPFDSFNDVYLARPTRDPLSARACQ